MTASATTFRGILSSELTEHHVGLIVGVALVVTMSALLRWLPMADRAGARRTALLAMVYLVDVFVGCGLQTFVPAIVPYHDVLPSVLLAAAVVSALSLLVFDLALARLRLRVGVPGVMRDLIQIAVFLAVVIAILHMNGVNPLSLLTTSVVFSAVVGFALQDTISNYFAGVALQIEKTIAVGDWIESDGRVGRIEAIRLRATTIVTKDGDLVALPNNLFLKGHIRNLSRPSRAHRMWIKIGVGYEHSPREVQRILVTALAGLAGIQAEPPHDCVMLEFGDTAVSYALRYWIADIADDARIDTEARTLIWEALRGAGIEHPRPLALSYGSNPGHKGAR